MSYSWDEVRTQVRQIRADLQSIYPLQVLSIVKDFRIHNNVLYFLSNLAADDSDHQGADKCPTRHLQIYQVDLEQLNEALYDSEAMFNSSNSSSSIEEYISVLSEHMPLLKRKLTFSNDTISSQSAPLDNSVGDTEQSPSSVPPQQQQQQQLQGVSTFQIVGNSISVTFQNQIYFGDIGKIPKLIPHREIPNQSTSSTLSSLLQPIHSPIANISSTLMPAQTASTVAQPIPIVNRADPKLGGCHQPLISYVRDGDIWVSDQHGHETQLTFCSLQKHTDPTLKCGVAEYMMQEEFHRFTGYEWCPATTITTTNTTNNAESLERILYLETTEKDVEEVYLSKASSWMKPAVTNAASGGAAAATDSVRYPRAGQPNAKSVVKIVEFNLTTAVAAETTENNRLPSTHIVHKGIPGILERQFPWSEYIVRFGWFADGQSVWLQLISRDQKRTAVVKVDLSQFKEVSATNTTTAANMTAAGDTSDGTVEVLWEETSEMWINVSDAFYFMKPKCHHTTRFIWSSEKVNGFRHLFLIEKRKEQIKPTIRQLTSGEWCCVDKALFVDEERSLVYFSAKKHTPLETHFYVISYANNAPHLQEPFLLTRLGFSHQVTMDSPDCFIDCFSTLHRPHAIAVQKLQHIHSSIASPTSIRISRFGLLIPVLTEKDCCSCQSETPPPSPPAYHDYYCHNQDPPQKRYNRQCRRLHRRHRRCSSSSSSSAIQYPLAYGPDLSDEESPFCYSSSLHNGGNGVTTVKELLPELNGEIFQFTTSDGELLYGCLYKPLCYRPGHSYPTLLHIYGGPKTQLVVNEFRFPRLMRYLMGVYFGFAVVIIDGRGSSDRGMAFESHIKYRLGKVELKDQLEGLQFLHDTMFGAVEPAPFKAVAETRRNSAISSNNSSKRKKSPVIDLNRVAITGWSYGGYLSLIALAQYPERFKMAVAGAPVTNWELYDAAYTERYMGLPSENKEAYNKSNVLTYIEQFPSEEHRLLIAHGLIDENVHFTNTELLVSQLVRHKKPHYLQVYPTEKHGLRHASVNEHFETLMFYWLVNYL